MKRIVLLLTLMGAASCKNYDHNIVYQKCMQAQGNMDPVVVAVQEKASGMSSENGCKLRALQCNQKYGDETGCNKTQTEECVAGCSGYRSSSCDMEDSMYHLACLSKKAKVMGDCINSEQMGSCLAKSRRVETACNELITGMVQECQQNKIKKNEDERQSCLAGCEYWTKFTQP